VYLCIGVSLDAINAKALAQMPNKLRNLAQGSQMSLPPNKIYKKKFVFSGGYLRVERQLRAWLGVSLRYFHNKMLTLQFHSSFFFIFLVWATKINSSFTNFYFSTLLGSKYSINMLCESFARLCFQYSQTLSAFYFNWQLSFWAGFNCLFADRAISLH